MHRLHLADRLHSATTLQTVSALYPDGQGGGATAGTAGMNFRFFWSKEQAGEWALEASLVATIPMAHQ